MSLALIAALFFVYIINEDLSFNSSRITIVICFLIIFISSLFHKIDFSSKNIYFFLLYVFFVFFSAISISSYFDADDVKKGRVFSGTEITFIDTVIKSNDSFYFIGKTEGYIFFYDAKSGAPSIYRTNDVKKILFVSERVYRGGVRPEQAPLVP